MTRPTIFLVLIALTLVVVSAKEISVIKTLGDSPAQPGNDALRGIHNEINKIADMLDPNSKPWGGLQTNNPYEAYEGLETCKENLKNCSGKLLTCDADLSACKTNNSDCSACNAAFSDCETNHTTCRFDLSEAREAKKFAETQTVLKSSQLIQCRHSLNQCEAGDQAPDCSDHSAEEKVECETCKDILDRAIRRQRKMCDMRLENQRSEIEVIEQIVGSESTQAPPPAAQDPSALPPAWQGPPAPPPAAQDPSALPPAWQGPPAPPPAAQDSSASPPAAQDSSASPPAWQGPPAPPASAPPAPDYTRHFYIFWLVVLVCFGFRIGPRVVRNAERRLRDASERRLRDACARNDVHWHTYSPAVQEFQFQFQLTKLRRLERNWSFFERFSRFLGFE